jgi:hypothetical protein
MAPAHRDRGEADPGKEEEPCRHVEPWRDQPALLGSSQSPPGAGLVVGAAPAASAHIRAAASSGEMEGDGMGPPPGARTWAPSMPWPTYCRRLDVHEHQDPASVVHGHQPPDPRGRRSEAPARGHDRGLERVRAGRRVIGGHDSAPLVHPEGVRPPRGPAMPSAWAAGKAPSHRGPAELHGQLGGDLQVGVEPSQAMQPKPPVLELAWSPAANAERGEATTIPTARLTVASPSILPFNVPASSKTKRAWRPENRCTATRANRDAESSS